MAREPDDDDVHVIDTVVEKSDRLAREYQKEREARARSKSVRRLDDEPRNESRNRRHRSQSGHSSSTRPRERGESGRPSERKPSGRERRAPGPEHEKLSDPFPPLTKDREPSRGRPAAPAKDREPSRGRPPAPAPQQRRDELPRGAPVAPEVTEPAHTSMDLLAMELEEQIREARFGWRSLRAADRLTLICSVFMVAGVLMPWRSDPAHPMQLGLQSGGILHLAIALASFALVVRSAKQVGIRVRDDLIGYRRISLWLVLLGAVSTALGAFLLLLYGLEKAPDWPVNIHLGVYWTLVSGTGVSYGGYARFSDVRRQARQ